MNFNPYSVLKVPRDADDTTIKKAYRKLAMKWHPDKNQDNPEMAEEMFESISKAYQILSDPNKRKQYDLSTPLPGRPNIVRTGGPGRSNSYFNNPNRVRSFQATSFDQLYNQFYGPKGFAQKQSSDDDSFNNRSFSSSMSTHQSPSEEKHIPKCFSASSSELVNNDDIFVDTLLGDINVPVNCTLEDIYHCATKMLVVRRCIDGNLENKSLKVTLTPGIANGTKIVLKNQGNRDSPSSPHDMIFIITVQPHTRFVRRDNDIVENITISLKDAISENYELNSIAVDGEPVSYKVTETIQPESEYRVKERGMNTPDNGKRGDHVFKLHVTIPLFTPEEREKIMEILK